MKFAILITVLLITRKNIVWTMPAGGEAVPCGDQVQCLVSPCSVSVLQCAEFYQGATCTDDFCGGCNAIWKDKDGNVIECDPCAFPGDCGALVLCIKDPCELAEKPKCSPDKATCISNFCGGCNAVWVDENGKKLPQECDCVDCHGYWSVSKGNNDCKDCTCADIRSKGKKFVKHVCKKFEDVSNNCCQLCS